MKVVIAFLVVVLSCYFGPGETFGSSIPLIPTHCLEKLIKVDVPESLTKLQNLLCLYMKAKKEHNETLYKQFLVELHKALKDAGCAVDEILTIEKFLEKVGDKVGEVAEQLGMEILKLLESLKVQDLVLNFLCELLGEPLKNLSKLLGGLNLNLG